ncbi:hypothetical protein BDV06DRAFT_119176 [Aspergillus oleicola]
METVSLRPSSGFSCLGSHCVLCLSWANWCVSALSHVNGCLISPCSRSDIVAQKFLPFVANYASLARVDWCSLHPWLSALDFANPQIGMMGSAPMKSRFIQLISLICRQVIPHPPPPRCRVQFGSIRPSATMIGCSYCASTIADTECGTVDLR